MALPSSGPISMYMVAEELGISIYDLSLNDSRVRNLAGIPSGPISLSDLYGKSAYTPMTLTSSNVYAEADTRFGAGSVAVEVAATLTGGEGPYDIQWSITSQSDGLVTMRFGTELTCLVSHTYSRNSSGSAWALLSCVVTDGTGRQASVNAVRANLSWYRGDL